MHGKESLYYAMGEMAYAIAKSDGQVQKAERAKIAQIVSAGISKHEINFDFADTIFQVLQKDDPDAETSYRWAMKEFSEHSTHLTKEMADSFVKIMIEIATAFGVSTEEETSLVNRFRHDIGKLVH